VSVDISNTLSEWDVARDALAEVRAVGDDFEKFFNETSAELESMGRLLQQHEQRARQPGAEHCEGAPRQDGGELASMLDESREINAALERQQATLEAELESVRRRAAETDLLLAEQRKDAAKQQTNWAGELKEMRATLEQLSNRISSEGPASERSIVEGAVVSAPVPDQPQAGARNQSDGGSDDVVLDSVMAQFQMLQQDVARRRENAPS
jgi:Skp family chaperone for outer membrane proteins